MRIAALNLLLLPLLLLGGFGLPPRTTEFAPAPQALPLDARPFGLNTHLATRYWDLENMAVPADIVANAGVGWAREDIHWFRVQPRPDVWDWRFNDQAISLLVQRGINVVGVIGHPPGWATPFPGDTYSEHSFYAPDPDRFVQFATAVVKRYSRYVKHWEIWNEPDNPLFWKPAPDPEAYASLLIRTATAIKLASPDSKILIGGVNPFDLSYLRRVAAAGAWASIDIMAIHPYVSPRTPEASGLINATEGVRTLMARYGERPIWVTEIGWSSGPGDLDPVGVWDEQGQADMLVRGMLALWQAGVERIFWYTLKDDANNPFGLAAFGQGYQDYSRLKPTYDALRTLNRQLSGARFVQRRDLYIRTPVHDFENFGGWARGLEPNGDFRPTDLMRLSGKTSAQLTYDFATPGNDFVVFWRRPPLLIPAEAQELGVWVYGDGSGALLKVWLQDSEGEILQYTLGSIGNKGWSFIKTPLRGTVPRGDRISSGNGRPDAPLTVEALILDDPNDSFQGNGTIYLDDLTAVSGAEAYSIQTQRNGAQVDVLWAPEPIRVQIAAPRAAADITDRNGRTITGTTQNGRLELMIGPSPVYVYHHD